jgi:hypothetical protein
LNDSAVGDYKSLEAVTANGWDDDIALLTALSHLSALMFGPIFAFNNVLFRILA